MEFELRSIEKRDNVGLAEIIRTSLEQLDCALDGTVYTDPKTDRMSECYQSEDAGYWIAEVDGKMVGGSGIGKVAGEKGVCELQRMFLTKESRGKGIGLALMNKCLEFAEIAGYKTVYLETFPKMLEARKLYERSGFKYIDHAIGNTGHFSCNVFMVMDL